MQYICEFESNSRGHMQGLRTVISKVVDLRAAIKWYSEVFETGPYFDEPFYVVSISVVMNSDYYRTMAHLTRNRTLY